MLPKSGNHFSGHGMLTFEIDHVLCVLIVPIKTQRDLAPAGAGKHPRAARPAPSLPPRVEIVRKPMKYLRNPIFIAGLAASA
jgi:hypothetical protein